MGETIAIVATGDMGHAVGRALRDHGHTVVTDLTGRSARSIQLAAAGGLSDLGSLDAVIEAADLFLSIAPPSAAAEIAAQAIAAMQRTGRIIPFADCNAVSPMTAMGLAEDAAAAGVPFIDAGIIGLAPSKDRVTQFYASGAAAAHLMVLDGKGMAVTVLSDRVGDASAMKMCFASITKGTNALYAAALIVAARYGLGDALATEVSSRSPNVWQAMNRSVPWLAADAERWVSEMEEIAATYGAVGMPEGFHQGAADLFRHLASTPLAAETRETLDRSRTLEETIALLAKTAGTH
ncbi:MAG: NAD(P)-dependent oxidoreductase [Alphaproteobacteria bacterium]|nr:NAD(P)-dependent oxidoreductase [Alphaproteobacteria bacterium]